MQQYTYNCQPLYMHYFAVKFTDSDLDSELFQPRLGDVLIQNGEVVGLLTSTYNIGAEMFAYYGFPFSNQKERLESGSKF